MIFTVGQLVALLLTVMGCHMLSNINLINVFDTVKLVLQRYKIYGANYDGKLKHAVLTVRQVCSDIFDWK